MKNCVVAFDGTGGDFRVSARDTNVALLVRLLVNNDLEQPSPIYVPGLGSAPDERAWGRVAQLTSRVEGLAFGVGFKRDLQQAYLGLMELWKPGDHLFVFGFSRGAYTARAFCGLLEAAGLLPAHQWSQVDRLIKAFVVSKKRPDLVAQSRRAFGSPNPVYVDFLGIWDTVKSLPRRAPYSLPSAKNVPNVRMVRHAVSIDEDRIAYKSYPLEGRPAADLPEEVWFPGVHSDVGGTPRHSDVLSKQTFRWVVEAAEAAGLKLDVGDPLYRSYMRDSLEYSGCRINSNKLLWVVPLGPEIPVLHRRMLKPPVGRVTRPIVPEDAWVHDSVKALNRADPRYTPQLPARGRWWPSQSRVPAQATIGSGADHRLP